MFTQAVSNGRITIPEIANVTTPIHIRHEPLPISSTNKRGADLG